jgi:hypothetical protein
MTSFHCRVLFSLLAGIFLAAAIILLFATAQPVQSFALFKLRGKDNNPDAFYLCATGEMISYGFIYDPHAADDWTFRTAEGSLGKLGQSRIIFAEKANGK